MSKRKKRIHILNIFIHKCMHAYTNTNKQTQTYKNTCTLNIQKKIQIYILHTNIHSYCIHTYYNTKNITKPTSESRATRNEMCKTVFCRNPTDSLNTFNPTNPTTNSTLITLLTQLTLLTLILILQTLLTLLTLLTLQTLMLILH
jgi:hypothetical protein